MAGLGRRTFQAGEVLTASNVMAYLQDQAVMNFAGTAARGSAIGTAVSEGMVSYLADTNDVQAYDGSAWLSVKNPIGSIVQAASTTKTDTFTTSSTSFADVTGLSVSITPKSASNKILVIVTIQAASLNSDVISQLVRGSTAIGNGASGFSLTRFSSVEVYGSGITYLDSPNTTSSTTYKVQVRSQDSGNTAYINRRSNDSFYTLASSITVMEVVA